MGDDDWDRKRKRRKYDRDDRDRHDDRDDWKKSKLTPSLIDRSFQLLDSPVATNLIKTIATGFIGITTLGLVAISAAFGLASIDILGLTIGGGALSTLAVWIFGGKKKQQIEATTKAKELANLHSKLQQLEERLTNVEVIESFENRLAEKTATQDLSLKAKAEQSLNSPEKSSYSPPSSSSEG